MLCNADMKTASANRKDAIAIAGFAQTARETRCCQRNDGTGAFKNAESVRK